MKLHLSVFRDFWKFVFIKKNSGEQEKESIIRVRVGLKIPSLRIKVCRHSASLVMPKDNPGDRYFYPTITLMTDSYTSTPLISGCGCCLFLFLLPLCVGVV